METMAAQSLGVPLALIRLHTADTDRDPIGGMTTASRATFVSGNAVLLASKGLREKLWSAVAGEFGISPEAIEISEVAFVNKGTGQRYIGLKELAQRSERIEFESRYDAPETNAVPKYIPESPQDQLLEHHLHFAYSFGVQAAMVAVNEETGEVRVLKMITAQDVGKAINRRACIGQMKGATVQGLGYALSEVFRMKDGYPQVKSFKDLGLFRFKNVPEIEAILIENPHPKGPYGAKGMGELALSPTAPAVINAIHDAVGVWINALPATPARVLAAIKAAKAGKIHG